jgi:hypothetical protein
MSFALSGQFSKTMFKRDFTFTKKYLGLLMLFAGIVGIIGIVGIDVLDVGREGGIGPAQRIALGLAILIVFIGLTLIPLGNSPA